MKPWTLLPQRLPSPTSSAIALATDDHAYLIDGQKVWSAPIQGDGGIGRWTSAGSVPVTMSFGNGIIHDDKMFLYGGTAAPARLWVSTIHKDGTVGAFKAVNQFQATFSTVMGVVAKGDWIYIIGGSNTNPIAEVRAVRASDPTQFRILAPLPGERLYIHPVVFGNYIYVFGGADVGFADTATIHSARIEQDGSLGPWKTVGSLPAAMSRVGVQVLGDRAYTLCGRLGAGNSDAIYSYQLQSGGTVGPHKVEDRFPVAMRSNHNMSFTAKDRIYILGGFTTVNLDTIYVGAPR